MPAYCSMAELKTFLRIPNTDTDDDALLTLVVEAATDAIDKALGTTGTQLSPVPDEIKLACELQAERWFKRRDAPFGVAGAGEFGNVVRLLPKLDPDVEMMISGYGERLRYGTTV